MFVIVRTINHQSLIKIVRAVFSKTDFTEFYGVFWSFYGVKVKNSKKLKNSLEILANYTGTYIPNFKKIGPSVWSLALRTDTQTHTHTDTHTHVCKPYVLRTLIRPIRSEDLL